MKELKELIKKLNGKEIKLNNILMPKYLYLLPNNIWLSIDYDQKDNYNEIKLGSLYLYNDSLPKLFVLESFEWYLELAKKNNINVNYNINYNDLTFNQIIDNLLLNLKIILDNYKELSSINK